jgi:dipeptidyl aminopeptidase/acylaminoacyl peptidase
VFFADRVSTPLLILHNDQDDAVPWYQGIELYISLRRDDKEVYLFCYNGEKHGIPYLEREQEKEKFKAAYGQ